jgi:hypothetical protein
MRVRGTGQPRYLYLVQLLLLMTVITASAVAQPRTPTVLINEKFRLVELAKSQRATLRYDLSSIGGEHLKVKLYRHDQMLDEKPLKEWLFHGVSGRERISFKELPLAVYTVVAYCCNESGEALAYAAPVIHVEYGGWRAWEEFQPPVETVEGKPEGFEDVEAATKISNRDIGIELIPRAVVIKPGQTATFKPYFREMEAERIEWKLVGEGKLKPIEDGQYLYTAPAEQLGTKLFRVEVQSVSHPDLKGGATILVTNASQDQLNQ